MTKHDEEGYCSTVGVDKKTRLTFEWEENSIQERHGESSSKGRGEKRSRIHVAKKIGKGGGRADTQVVQRQGQKSYVDKRK